MPCIPYQGSKNLIAWRLKEWVSNLDYCLFVSEYTNYLGLNECFSLEKFKTMNGANKSKAIELLPWNEKHGRRLSLFD